MHDNQCENTRATAVALHCADVAREADVYCCAAIAALFESEPLELFGGEMYFRAREGRVEDALTFVRAIQRLDRARRRRVTRAWVRVNEKWRKVR